MDVTGGTRRRLLCAAAVAIAALAALVITQASAQGEELRLSRVTVAVGDEATLRLEANGIGGLGLGAWQIGIFYNDAVVDPVACDAAPVGINVCNQSFARNRVEVVGASAAGETGDTVLADITFRFRQPCPTRSFRIPPTRLTWLSLANGPNLRGWCHQRAHAECQFNPWVNWMSPFACPQVIVVISFGEN
jgi:hypothetical protein